MLKFKHQARSGLSRESDSFKETPRPKNGAIKISWTPTPNLPMKLSGERLRSLAHALQYAEGKYPVNCQRNINGNWQSVQSVESAQELKRLYPARDGWYRDEFLIIRPAG